MIIKYIFYPMAIIFLKIKIYDSIFKKFLIIFIYINNINIIFYITKYYFEN